MRCIKYLLIIIFLSPFALFAQDTLFLSREASEALFLKENIQLLAEKLEISHAEAKLIQAKLWPNPTLEIDEVNLWTNNQLQDTLEGFNGGNFGKNQQVAIAVEQLIYTARKRKKLVAIEKISLEQSKEYFEDVLRILKIEFRKQLTEFQFLQQLKEVYGAQFNSIQTLSKAYKNQLEQGNIGKGEYIRLKASELEISKNLNDLNNAINKSESELKILMHLPANTILKIQNEGYKKDVNSLHDVSLNQLIDSAKENRPDFKIAALEESYYNSLLRYEKAKRVPDLSLKAGYDRGGGIMYDFVGFGLSIDLPFFDRNQGNIQSARVGIEQAELKFKEKELRVENEIVLAYKNLHAAITFFEQIDSNYEETIDELLVSYTKNFSNRNINIVEYLDFLDAYLENKKIILEAILEVNVKAEELNFSVGSDIVQ